VVQPHPGDSAAACSGVTHRPVVRSHALPVTHCSVEVQRVMQSPSEHRNGAQLVCLPSEPTAVRSSEHAESALQRFVGTSQRAPGAQSSSSSQAEAQPEPLQA